MYNSPDYSGPLQKEAGMAVQLIKHTSTSFFLTGKPGTGKSTFLKKIVGESGKKYIWLSPGSLAAINAGGASLHSFFHLAFSPFIWQTADKSQKNIFFNFHAAKRKIIEQVELIIIDDVQLLRADIIDAIDFRLRRFGGKRNLPFGGRQIVFTGDIVQLPDVASAAEWDVLRKYYNTPFFFSARALLKATLPVIAFTQQFGRQEEAFTSLMELVRSKQVQLPDVQELNQLYAPVFSEEETEGYISITANAGAAEIINRKILDNLTGQLYTWQAVTEGKFAREFNNDSSLPANEELQLKENAQVIFTKDDAGGKWLKGEVGKVAGITGNAIQIQLLRNEMLTLVTVEKVNWYNNRYEANAETGAIKTVAQGVFTQYPLRLGWAVAASDSTGLQFEKVVIDLGEGEPVQGVALMALCRCKSLKNLKLLTIISEEDLLVRDEVVRMLKTANNEALISSAVASGMLHSNIRKFIKEFDCGNFPAAIESFSKAIQVKSEYRLPAFQRLMGLKFSRLKRGSGQVLTMQDIPIEQPVTVPEPDTILFNARIAQLEKLVEEVKDKQQLANVMAEKQDDIDLKLIVLNNELEVQQRSFFRVEEILASNKAAAYQREMLDNATARYSEELAENIALLQNDFSGWKKLTLIGGIILTLIAAAALLLAIL